MDLQICGTFDLEFELIHANLRGMYRMYKIFKVKKNQELPSA
jgi:hypothetical protein